MSFGVESNVLAHRDVVCAVDDYTSLVGLPDHILREGASVHTFRHVEMQRVPSKLPGLKMKRIVSVLREAT